MYSDRDLRHRRSCHLRQLHRKHSHQAVKRRESVCFVGQCFLFASHQESVLGQGSKSRWKETFWGCFPRAVSYCCELLTANNVPSM